MFHIFSFQRAAKGGLSLSFHLVAVGNRVLQPTPEKNFKFFLGGFYVLVHHLLGDFEFIRYRLLRSVS
jgi:hypothetical protein